MRRAENKNGENSLRGERAPTTVIGRKSWVLGIRRQDAWITLLGDLI
jgi:hypothetical protein